MGSLRTSSGKAAALLAVGALGAAAAVAVANVPGSNGVIHACVDVSTGAGGALVPNTSGALPHVTVIDPGAGEHCISPDGTDTLQTTLSWNGLGRQGPTGPRGPAGRPGTGTSTVTYTIVPPVLRPTASPEGGATFGTGPGAIHFNVLSFGLTHSPKGSGSSGRADLGNLTISKFVDKSSLVLYRACSKGTHFDNATLYVRKKSGGGQKFFVIKMTGAVITSDQSGSTKSGERPTETLTLNFTKIEFKNAQ